MYYTFIFTFKQYIFSYNYFNKSWIIYFLNNIKSHSWLYKYYSWTFINTYLWLFQQTVRKQETAINKQSNSITRQTLQLFSNLILTWSSARRSRLLSSILQPGSYPINPKRSSIRPYRLIPQPRVKPAPGESIANGINDLLYNGLMEFFQTRMHSMDIYIYTNRWPKRKESAIYRWIFLSQEEEVSNYLFPPW